MADLDRTVQYTFQITDNVTPTAERIAGAQEKATVATERTNSAIDSQNIKFITQLAAVGAAYGGLRRMTSGMHELGLIADADAAKLNKIVSVVGIVSGAFMTLKGAIKVLEGLRSIEISVAAVETYRAVLKNPAALAVVGAGLAAGGAVAGYAAAGGFSSSSNKAQVTQTINISGMSPQDSRSYARETFEMMGG